MAGPNHVPGMPLRRRPFVDWDIAAAWRYDAWYAAPVGRRMAAAEARVLTEMLGRWPGARTLLEVGCGTGHFCRVFARRGLDVVGLDSAPGMLAVARERGGGPRYVRGAASSLPFRDSSVDVAALITSLEFMDAPTAVLREAARVSRRGMLLGVLNAASLLGLRRRVVARFRPSPYRHARFYTPWSLERLVRDTLGARVAAIGWRTVLWPAPAPRWAEGLPWGGFIGLAVTLRPSTGGAL